MILEISFADMLKFSALLEEIGISSTIVFLIIFNFFSCTIFSLMELKETVSQAKLTESKCIYLYWTIFIQITQSMSKRTYEIFKNFKHIAQQKKKTVK